MKHPYPDNGCATGAAKPAPIPPLRECILREGIALTTGDRNAAYGDPTENLTDTARIFHAMTGINISPQDVALFYLAGKLARLKVNPSHIDSVVDGATYLAIFGEVRRNMAEREEGALVDRG